MTRFFGLQMPSFTFEGLPTSALFERIADTAVAAEDSGFGSFWVMDHYHQIGTQGPPSEPMLEAYTVLSGVAARTSRIRLGAMVTGVTYRNPAFLAKVVTTLDVVSSGRAILGIGAAWNEEESRAYGYPWPGARERLERLEDALRICRAMFTQERSTVEGTHHSVDGAYNVPQPVQPGGPRILVGGGGERRTLRLVATYADLWNGFGSPEEVRRKLEILAEHCRDVGRDPAEIVTTRLGTVAVADTMEEAERLREGFQRRRGLDDDATRGSLIWGTPDVVAERVQEYLDTGLDGLVINLLPGSTPDDVRRVGELVVGRFGEG
jgi:F420-dependent oxidoreductase-like protein